MSKFVYLSGYMNNDVPETKDWRNTASDYLSFEGIDTLDPWRGKTSSNGKINLEKKEPRLLIDRDFNDCQRSDIILINLNQYGIQRQMIGTLAELGWAWALRKPTVIFAKEGEPNLNHPFVCGIATVVCNSLQEAIEWVVFLAKD